jgi:type 1 glutamine amidotransferase
VLFENRGHHIAYSTVVKKWLSQLATDSNFTIDYINNTKPIDDDYLAQYQLFIHLDHPPYGWKDKAVAAFERDIKGRGGWIGFHYATLLGEFDGYAMWPWFSDFMGGIRFTNYIADFADGTVSIEATIHPCMKSIPKQFTISKEERYTYDKSPRPTVHVIASVDESDYKPASAIKMGDQPVVWANPNYAARNIYIFMGHAPELFDNSSYITLFRNSIFWLQVNGLVKINSERD